MVLNGRLTQEVIAPPRILLGHRFLVWIARTVPRLRPSDGDRLYGISPSTTLACGRMNKIKLTTLRVPTSVASEPPSQR